MKILRLSVFFLFFASWSAFAGELDSYYLQQFGELTTEPAKTVLKSAQTSTLHKCGMPLHHNLKRDWKILEAGTQKTLAKYLEKPALADPRIVISNGNHFRIHYASTGADAPPLADNDIDGIPDWVETVADVFEAVYDREVTQLKYNTPPNMPYDVYLRTLVNFLGLTTSDIVSGQSATSFIEIDKDFKNFSIPYTPLALLKITAAHEFQHAIQYGYNFFFEAWYAEASATWMEDEVYDSVNQLYDYTAEYLANTASPLDFGVGYSRWIFNRYLFEQDTSQDMMLKIWSTFALERSIAGADIPMLPFIDKVLQTQGGSLAASFSGFAKRIYLRNWSSHLNDINLIPNYLPKTTYSSYPVNSASPSTPTATLPAHSFEYFRFTPSSSAPINLNITFSPSGSFSITAFKKTTGGVITEYPLTTSGGNLTIDSFNAPGTAEVSLLICNTSAATAAVAFSTDGSLPPVQAAAGNGDGGGSCFIATAAYGSYLHPEVMTLRNFRDRHLLTNMPGRAFVALYYRLSPPVADFIRTHESAGFIVRILLAPIIFAVKHPATVMATAAILLLMACSRVWKRAATKTAVVSEGR